MVKYQKGYTLRDSTLHVAEDHHKKKFPGVGYYSASQAFDNTAVLGSGGPTYTFGREDLMDLDTI